MTRGSAERGASRPFGVAVTGGLEPVLPQRATRREFTVGGLGAVGLGLAAPLLASCGGRNGEALVPADQAPTPTDEPPAADPEPADDASAAPASADERIVIVGAGVAALAAVQELEVRGFENVVILEAQDRVGGRVWTGSIGDGIPVELGATWIHGIRSNPIHEIAESNGIATAPTDYDNTIVYDQSGRETPWVDEQLWRAYMRLAYERPDQSLQAVYDEFAAANGFDDHHDRLLWQHVLNSMLEHEFGADVSDLSIMSYDGGSDMRGGDVVFPGGYSQIIDVLAAGRDIRLRHPVAEIDHTGDEVAVTTGTGTVFEADRVIVTVPLGVLKAGDISFVPSLPPDKQAAIDALAMGVLNRTSLLFDDVFWAPDVEWIGYLSEQKGEWSETLNLYPYQQQPVLAMFNAGSFGAEVEQYSDDELTGRAVAALRAIFGDVPDPVDSVSTRWVSDPWTKGSYSYVPAGASFENYRVMARPAGERVFFAGEATHSRFPSTVHGAFLSGKRVARQISGLLR